jgi:hypothetical protein
MRPAVVRAASRSWRCGGFIEPGPRKIVQNRMKLRADTHQIRTIAFAPGDLERRAPKPSLSAAIGINQIDAAGSSILHRVR